MEILRPGRLPRQALADIEKKISALLREIEMIGNAPVPDEELRARLKTFLEREVYSRTPEQQFSTLRGPRPGFAVLPDAINFATLAFLFGVDQVADMIMAKIVATGEPAGLPAAERAKRVAELRSQVRAAEHAAEIEALKLEDAGYSVLRHENADPEMIFEVWANTTADASQRVSATAKT